MRLNNIHNMEIDEHNKIMKLKKQFGDWDRDTNGQSNYIYGFIYKYYDSYLFNYYQQYYENHYKKIYNIKDNNKTNKIIDNKNISTNNANKLYESKDCIIEIPDIDLSKIVYTGSSRLKHLDNYELVTASNDMKYSNGGNYIICGHASRLYGHSLNRLKEVQKYALIRIWANNEVDDYIVDKVYYENMNNTDKYCKQSNKNEITIISCAKYISKESYIIIKAIPK